MAPPLAQHPTHLLQPDADGIEVHKLFLYAVYAMGFYMDENAAKQACSKEFSCLPPVSLERNQALAERASPYIISQSCLQVPGRPLPCALDVISCAHAYEHASWAVAAREQVLPAAGVKAAHDIEKSVRIVVTSGLVNQERFSKGLRESLEPRLRAVRPLA